MRSTLSFLGRRFFWQWQVPAGGAVFLAKFCVLTCMRHVVSLRRSPVNTGEAACRGFDWRPDASSTNAVGKIEACSFVRNTYLDFRIVGLCQATLHSSKPAEGLMKFVLRPGLTSGLNIVVRDKSNYSRGPKHSVPAEKLNMSGQGRWTKLTKLW